MATRENQGLFIAVILLVLLAVVLAVATYFGFSGMKEVADQRDSFETNLKAERLARQGYQAQSNILKAYLGFEGVPLAEVGPSMNDIRLANDPTLLSDTDRITELYEIDRGKLADPPEGTDVTYRKLMDYLNAAIDDQYGNTSELNHRIARAESKLKTELAAKDQEILEIEKQLADARTDLRDAKTAHDETKTQYAAQLDKAQGELDSTITNLKTTQSNLQTTIEDHATVIANKDKTIQRRDAEIAQLRATETTIPDGQIVHVAPGLGKVSINLGSKDNLKLKQAFAIHDKNSLNFKTNDSKATIEITRIIDEHLSEGTITFSSTDNPILIGDHCVTPTWDRGNTISVAIAGRIDLDGDGVSDLERFISMLRQNGAKVVAYHDEDGKILGEGGIDEDTRWFIVGDTPFTRGKSGYDTLKRQRETFQVREISAKNFMAKMGISSGAKIQRFDNSENPAASKEFVPRSPTTVDEGSPFGG